MHASSRPLTTDRMYRALLERDREYDGLFYFGVRTTGIFCRPSCTARKPLRHNVRFFVSAGEAIARGFRPCLRCRPLECRGQMPTWLEAVVAECESDLQKRWSDTDLRSRGVDPTRMRRWFQRNLGTTFHNHIRASRLAAALSSLASGAAVTQTAFAAGYQSLSGFHEAFGKWFGSPLGTVGHGRRVIAINRALSPLGPLIAAADDTTLFLLEFADRRTLRAQLERLRTRIDCDYVPGENAVLMRTSRQLDEYFAGTRRDFSLPVEYPGTAFQRAVWTQLTQIPYGQTRSYQSIAQAVGSVQAVRAVGRANGDNRLAIVLPCHRVVGYDGRLAGYGGGVHRKEWLLAHERSVCSNGSLDGPLAKWQGC